MCREIIFLNRTLQIKSNSTKFKNYIDSYYPITENASSLQKIRVELDQVNDFYELKIDGKTTCFKIIHENTEYNIWNISIFSIDHKIIGNDIWGGGITGIETQLFEREYLLFNFLLKCILNYTSKSHNIIPFHSSVCCIGDKVIAFIGSGKSGKSTLSYLLGKEGFEILSDEYLFVDAISKQVFALHRNIKLRKGIIEINGIEKYISENLKSDLLAKNEIELHPFPITNLTSLKYLQSIFFLNGFSTTLNCTVCDLSEAVEKASSAVLFYNNVGNDLFKRILHVLNGTNLFNLNLSENVNYNIQFITEYLKNLNG